MSWTRNGSYGRWFKSFAVYSNDVPSFLVSNENTIELDSWTNWDAKDIFRFPGSDTILIQYDYYIGIYCCGEHIISIPVNLDEYIVSINFADNTTQKVWLDELHNIN